MRLFNLFGYDAVRAETIVNGTSSNVRVYDVLCAPNIAFSWIFLLRSILKHFCVGADDNDGSSQRGKMEVLQ